MTLVERFLKYVSFDTQSSEETEITPSTPGQMVFARYLKEELESLGLEEITLDENGYLFATLPANTDKPLPVIGFIAHMDTSPDMSGKNVSPRIVQNYDGKDIVLCAEENVVLSTARFPELLDHQGEDLIVTDGKTLLGADDKAGVAEIMTMAEALIKENIPHGPISIAFTPDEEVGGGTDHFNVEKFGAQFAYTLDGDTEGEIQYENFNACKADFEITGFAVHPGSSKDTMINACLVAAEINNMLPGLEIPRETEDYEGFYHLTGMSGDVAKAELHYIVRDHDKNLFEARKETLRHIEKNLNEKWGEGTVKLMITDQYQNLAEIIAGCMHLIENAKKACENAGVAPLVLPIRGGTDGCQLSFMGLPCPNLGTGGHAFHGPYEHITAEGMDKAVDIVVELVKLYAEM